MHTWRSISGKCKKRKAVSDVIATLLLVAITVTGGTLLFVLINGSNLTNSIGGTSNQNLPPQILLLGYDTRDSYGLAGINSASSKPLLNNTISDTPANTLCTISCKLNANNKPATLNGGTEYITLRIRNAGATSVSINSLTVNEVSHAWAAGTAGTAFDPSINANINDKNSPTAGKFSIIKSSTSLTQQSSLIPSSTDAILIIKLSSAINPDIPNTSVIRINLNVQNINAATTFAIPAGSAK